MNFDLLYRNYLIVNKNILSKKIYEELYNDLIINIPEYIGEEITLKFIFENDKFVFLPRNYPIWKYLDLNSLKVYSDYTNGENIDIEQQSWVKYRDDIQKKASIFLQTHDEGILSLPPGKGKTFIVIDSICKIKKKTMIVVDQIKLLNQWIEEIIKFTTLKKEDIGIVREDKMELDKPIVIVSIQTIISKLKTDADNLINNFYKANFGMTIIDEVHTAIGPGALTKVCSIIFSKKLFGVSATAYRLNETDKILGYTLGLDEFKNLQYDLIPEIQIIQFNSGLPSTSKYFYNRGGKFNKMNYLKSLNKHSLKYFELIKNIVNLSYNNNRSLLILSDIIAILDKIEEKIFNEETLVKIEDIEQSSKLIEVMNKSKKYKQMHMYEKIKENKSVVYEQSLEWYRFYNKEEDVEYMIDSQTKEVFSIKRSFPKDIVGKFISGSEDNEKNKQFVLATFKMMNKGISVDHLDSLILATPVGSPIVLEQSIGRILRLKEGKKKPIVYDLVPINDDIVITKLYERRLKFYGKMGFVVKTFKF